MLTLLLLTTVLVALIVALLVPGSPKVPAAPNCFATAGGTTTAAVHEPGHSDSKGTVLLVHGFCENHLYFDLVSADLVAAGYTAVAINLYGYAGSQPSHGASYRVQDYASQILEVAAEIDQDPGFAPLVGIWGHSMGATSLFCSLPAVIEKFPSLRLLVFEAPGFPETVSLFSRFLIPSSALADSWLVRRFLQLWTDLLFVPKVHNAPGRRFLRRILVDYAPTREVALGNVRSILSTHFDGIPEPWLERGCRFYFLFARSDRLVSFRRVGKHFMTRLPKRDGRILSTTFQNTDHFISLQRPELVARRVLHLLNMNGNHDGRQEPGFSFDSAPVLG